MKQRRKVVLTGAAGRIAGLLLPALKERYDLVTLDVASTNRDGETIAGVQSVDLLDQNRDAYRRHFQGADAVVHCAYVKQRGELFTDAEFAGELANIQLAYNVYQTAAEEHVRRVVVASSNHAADYYEPLILDGKWDVVTPEMKALSDNYYGWAKECYEHLGFVFACGKASPATERGTGRRPLENVQIRIGGPRETDVARCPKGDLRRLRRCLGVYISQRDLQQLVIKSIETPDIRDEHGVPFQIFYGISANAHAFWSIANARRVIGYAPRDNSEIRFRDLVSEHLQAAQEATP